MGRSFFKYTQSRYAFSLCFRYLRRRPAEKANLFSIYSGSRSWFGVRKSSLESDLRGNARKWQCVVDTSCGAPLTRCSSACSRLIASSGIITRVFMQAWATYGWQWDKSVKVPNALLSSVRSGQTCVVVPLGSCFRARPIHDRWCCFSGVDAAGTWPWMAVEKGYWATNELVAKKVGRQSRCGDEARGQALSGGWGSRECGGTTVQTVSGCADIRDCVRRLPWPCLDTQNLSAANLPIAQYEYNVRCRPCFLGLPRSPPLLTLPSNCFKIGPRKHQVFGYNVCTIAAI